MLFGIIEFGLLIRDYVSLTAATRAGARTASALPRVLGFTDSAAASVAKAGVAMPMSDIQELWVYKANLQGYPGADGVTGFTSCGTDCVKYTWNGTSFTKAGGSWLASDHEMCKGVAKIPSVGVYLQARHTTLTGLFGTTWGMQDHAVLRFEPLAPGDC